MKKSAKSIPPSSRPIGGIRTSPTNELTIFPNAAPMMMPTAMSRTLPRMTNFLKSPSMPTASRVSRRPGPLLVRRRLRLVERVLHGLIGRIPGQRLRADGNRVRELARGDEVEAALGSTAGHGIRRGSRRLARCGLGVLHGLAVLLRVVAATGRQAQAQTNHQHRESSHV